MQSVFLTILFVTVAGLLASGISATAQGDGADAGGCVQDARTHMYICDAP